MPPKLPDHKRVAQRLARSPTSKSTRQQFSACGACRMRRVRCDLKDVQEAATDANEPLACTNCQERGLQCVDEFADVKAVKQLRRGRRIQLAEKTYGKQPDRSPPNSPTPSSVIPHLKPEFFASAFYRRFQVQRPIIDPTEFPARYNESLRGNTNALPYPAMIIAHLLVVWAASYGVNEEGKEEPHSGPADLKKRRDSCNIMLREILHLIDRHGILRKPTWDGVRVLLLIMPLTEDVQTPMDRLAMYEATVSQVYTLCSLAPASSVNSGQGEYVDALVRARIYWYAHVHEGITTGLRGGRLLLGDDDLELFEATLPPHAMANSQAIAHSAMSYSFTHRYATAPIRLSSACRKVHAALTGPKARSRPEIDEVALKAAWEALEMSWEEFEELRSVGAVGIFQPEDSDRFVSGWQIFIFECQNIIREALKMRLLSSATSSPGGSDLASSSRPMHNNNSRLHDIAESKCRDLVKRVHEIIRRQLGTSFFAYDASLTRDGVFFASHLLAGELGSEEDVTVCFRALNEMRWAFSKSQERADALKLVWETRRTKEVHGNVLGILTEAPFDEGSVSPYSSSSNIPGTSQHQPHNYPSAGSSSSRSVPPPIRVPLTGGIDSAPSTAGTHDGRWATPSSSNSSMAHSPISLRETSPFHGGSPHYHTGNIASSQDDRSSHGSVSPETLHGHILSPQNTATATLASAVAPPLHNNLLPTVFPNYGTDIEQFGFPSITGHPHTATGTYHQPAAQAHGHNVITTASATFYGQSSVPFDPTPSNVAEVSGEMTQDTLHRTDSEYSVYPSSYPNNNYYYS